MLDISLAINGNINMTELYGKRPWHQSEKKQSDMMQFGGKKTILIVL